MNIKIGTIIKRLRAEKNITQDMLATAIGVTPQAISRWESESGYPDIELLPVLADFFSVSIDELVGYKLSEREHNLKSIYNELDRLTEDGLHEDRLSFARTAYSKYPYDHQIKMHLASCLIDQWDIEKSDTLLTEAENLCLSTIEDCRDIDIRYEAITTLCCVYSTMNRSEDAKNTIELLTPMKYCREFVLSNGIGDGKTEFYIQDEIHKLTDCLGTSIQELAVNYEVPNDPSTWNKKIEMLNTSNGLYRLIYGDNLMFNHVRLSWNYWLISTFQIAQGKVEDALLSLEKMCFHSVEYEKSYSNDHGKYYTSIFTDKLIYPEPSKDFHELTQRTNCYYMLEKLQNQRYDSIRNDSRFVNVINILSQYAR